MAEGKTSRSWFVTFNRPELHGYTGEPEEIIKRLRDEWCVVDGRVGIWAYCIKHWNGFYPVYDEEGNYVTHQKAITEEQLKLVEPDLHHVHMVLETPSPVRFSFLKKVYAIGAHFDITRGSKKEAEDYIAKLGDYVQNEKRENGQPWEEIICVIQFGEIKGRQGQRSDMQKIEKFLAEGKSPMEMLASDVRLYRYESMIRSAYFDKRDRETPPIRSVKVIWHTGLSGSGKSYDRMRLIEEVGEENIFYVSTFGPGMFDKYNGEPILWIEDFKGEIKFGDLLRYLDVYKCDLPARYKNGKALWKEVHITSVLHPLGAYQRMLKEKDRQGDSADQLLRRIFCIRYHWKNDAGYHWRDFPTSYSLETMRKICIEGLPDDGTVYTDPEIHNSQFETITDDDELPF